jgi:amino acid transporter
VEAGSAALRRELGTFDFVLAQIIIVVGSTWIGTAGKVGPAHLVLWLIASVFFCLPLAVVVIHLNRWLPLEGGLYQWAKVGFDERVGFLVAWNLGVWAIVLLSSLGLEIITTLSYAFGARSAWMASSGRFIAASAAVIFLVLVVTSALGLHVGKWVHNAAGAFRIAVYAILIGLPVVALAMGRHTEWHPVQIAAPTMSLFVFNILGKMGFGAFSAFEYVAIFSGEAPDPARSIGRSVIIAGPLVVLMFILGTSSVIAFVRPDDIDLIAPLPQVVSAGAGVLGGGGWLATVVSLGLAASTLGWGSATFSGVARLPMVAGWDGLLPEWFTRLHPRFRTPINSIVFIGVASLALCVAGMAGVGQQEAFQLFENAALILYALTYLVMFAIPIVGRISPRPPLWLRVASGSGFLMTLLFIVLSIFPIVKVDSPLVFTAKITSVVLGANALGVALFAAQRRRRARVASAAVSLAEP